MVTLLYVFTGLCIAVLALVLISSSSAIPAPLSNDDRLRLQKVFDEALVSQDIAAVQYAVLGYKLLGKPVPEQGVS